MEATKMSIDWWMDKEVVVHTHDGILLSHKKEHIWVSSVEVDEPRTYYTEWSELETEREILYSNTYIQNLEKWHWSFLNAEFQASFFILLFHAHQEAL